jgi:signal transduction histidine kinase
MLDSMRNLDFRAHPFATALGFLLMFGALFGALHGKLGDAVFIICNLLPITFGAFFGMRWGLGYAVVHETFGMVLAARAGIGFDSFISRGLLADIVTIILSGAVGRIRDLTTSLQRELAERGRYEHELREHKAHLESLVDARTAELVTSNERLRREIAEHEKTEEEKRKLAASLKRAERMEAIGVLAGSVAHDLNNILGSLVGYPDLLLLELPENSAQREALIAIRDSGMRATAVVQDLLTMARRGITSSQVLSLNEVVSDLMRSPEFLSLRAQYRDVRIEMKLDPGLLNVLGSSVHLSRAILNLAINSLEALDKGGQVTLATANVYVDTPSSGYEVLAEGEYVTLSVKDNGRGIPREDLDRIFEPFYTRKVMGRSGTGLGMAIVWGTVKDHNGFIDVQSEEGRGTIFTLLLPATREELRAAASKIRLVDVLGDGESILVVDDVKAQRDLCSAMLTRLGYAVDVVASGEEAMKYVARRPVDLLVLDMIMAPGIDGLETYRKIIETRPGQKAVIASGYAENEKVKEAQALGAGAYVRKPYTFEKLARVVKDELRR